MTQARTPGVIATAAPTSSANAAVVVGSGGGGAAAKTPIITLRQIVKTYGSGTAAFQALAGVDLDIYPQEFVAIMGPSGSGKSTALNILGCLDAPTSGQYFFNGSAIHSLDRNGMALLRRNYLGFVFQGFNLLSRTSAQENVELPLLYRGTKSEQRHSAARQALAKVGLTGWEHHTPAELSGGQQQRVAIARAIVTSPLVLLADEPTGNLDSKRSHEIMELLLSLNQTQGITIIMVTHEPDMAAYASRTITFMDGHIEKDSQNAVRQATPVSAPISAPISTEINSADKPSVSSAVSA